MLRDPNATEMVRSIDYAAKSGRGAGGPNPIVAKTMSFTLFQAGHGPANPLASA